MNRSEAEAHLDALWQRGREFLGSRYAIMGGAMTWVSERHLVAAISNGGGFGVIASGSMTPDVLAAEIVATVERTTKPFGVNLIIMHPQLEQLIDVCLSHGVTHIVLAGAATNWCIRATAYGALDRGYDLTLVKDAHTTESMQLDGGVTIEAETVIQELNIAMKWLEYPGLKNGAASANDITFAVPGGIK